MNINEVINYAKGKNLDTIEALLILELILKPKRINNCKYKKA